MKKIVFGFILFLLMPLGALAADYTITDYDINIKVNENNTYDITEKIQVNFPGENHGIFRTLPLTNTISRSDGSSETVEVKISNVKVKGSHKISQNKNYLNIQFGDPNKLVTGNQIYEFRYTYNIGKDSMTDYDEFYFNLIGTEWDTTIENVNFEITMPKKFDENNISFVT